MPWTACKRVESRVKLWWLTSEKWFRSAFGEWECGLLVLKYEDNELPGCSFLSRWEVSVIGEQRRHDLHMVRRLP